MIQLTGEERSGEKCVSVRMRRSSEELKGAKNFARLDSFPAARLLFQMWLSHTHTPQSESFSPPENTALARRARHQGRAPKALLFFFFAFKLNPRFSLFFSLCLI